MIDLLSALALILSAWMTCFMICFGLGRLVVNSLGAATHDAQLVIITFWIGWAVVIAFLQVWHLVFKVDGRAFAIITIAGLITLIRERQRLLRDMVGFLRRKKLLSSALVVLSLLLADQALRLLSDYDSGLYHLQVLRWTREYALVPGLGHVHGRFAFNNANFLYVTFVGVGPWRGIEHNIANSLLVMVVAAHALLSLDCAMRERRHWQVHHLFAVLLLLPLLDYGVVRSGMTSPSADIAAGMVQLTLMVELLVFLSSDDFTTRRTVHRLWFITLLAAVGIVIKLSAAVFSVAAVLLALGVWVAYNRGKTKRVLSVLAGVTLIACVLVVPWLVRGVVLSGYPVYPITLGAAPVSWRVPASQAIQESNWIRSWGRAPGQPPDRVLSGWDWVGPWLKREIRGQTLLIPACMTVGTALLVLFQGIKNRRALVKPRLLWAFLLPAGIAVVAWFLSAPGLEFAVSLLWGTAIGGSLIALSSYERSTRGLVVVLAFVVVSGAYMLASKSTLWITPGPERGFYPVQPAYVERSQTASGLWIYYPVDSDRCWDAPLPCAPGYKAALRLRGAGLQSGFEVGPVE